jgi:23S rRNA (cytosine1962-C5)-methyltransferase
VPVPVLSLRKNLRDAIHAGHPWVYDRALEPARVPLAPGELVRVADRHGPLALGYADPGSPIRVRILDRADDARPDAAWAAARMRRAAGCRLADPRLAGTDAWRLVHGENDFMPGLVIDLYAGVAVVVHDGPAARAFWAPLTDAVIDAARDAGAAIERVVHRPLRGAAAAPGPADVVIMNEHGAAFEVDVARGQKTGFFLDQRENRRLVAELAAGATVLNLFAYTGGFSVHAALAGARRVTTIDSAAPAIEAGRRNLARNGLDLQAHETLVVDAFDYLERSAAEGRRWDLVIVDPPSFAPRESARPKALRAYRRINELALAVVAPEGRLVTASCSSHVTEADLLAVLANAAAAAGRRVRVTDIRGADRDHPVLPAFPEGRYLTALFAELD